MSRRRGGERGQATVELALALPVVAVAALALVQVGLVVHARVLTTHAAREAARVVAVTNDPGAGPAAARRASGLDPDRVDVVVSGGAPGGDVTVTVTYSAPTDVPVVGAVLGDVVMVETVTMRAEGRRP